METTTIKNDPQTVQSKEEVAKELMKIWDKTIELTKVWDRDKYMEFWTKDYTNLLEYGVTQNLTETIDMVEDVALNNNWEFVEFKPLELFVENDMAFEFSLLEHNITPNDSGETVNTKMRCITIYKREDGIWKFHRWMPQPKIN